jgi:hypothetical protein
MITIKITTTAVEFNSSAKCRRVAYLESSDGRGIPYSIDIRRGISYLRNGYFVLKGAGRQAG